jgi:hypothetical protein
VVRNVLGRIIKQLGTSKRAEAIKKYTAINIREKGMFLHVVSVTYRESYKLRVKFSDGVVKDVDLKDELYGEIFEPLRDIKVFKQVVVNSDTNTIEWPNGADFAPEFLYKIGKTVKKVVSIDA